MTKRTLAVLLLLAIIYAVHGQTLYTLSGVNPSFTRIIEGTTSLSAVGVGSDGWTTYSQSGTVSLEVAEEASTTFTIVNPSAPAMLVGEFEENASGFRLSYFIPGGEHAETCAFGADGRGTCVERIVDATSTILDTFSGSVVPFYTLAVPAKDGSSPLTTPPPSPTASGSPPSSSPNGAAAKVFPLRVS
ncbi:hypothetical protein B0H13DRAFT_1985830 [Mycena leptocephala]|nr:hypothetical protein B0H13DRAFT_1985830 [Mycena leptocephala]